MNNLKIGSQVYAIHNMYVNKNMNGGKLRVCKIKGYENIESKVYPVFKEIGSTYSIDQTMYTIFTDLDKAIEALGPVIKKSRKKNIIKKNIIERVGSKYLKSLKKPFIL